MRKLLASPLVVGLMALIAQLIAFQPIWQPYQPWFDNIPLFVYSTPMSPYPWTHWFTEGYQKYFDAHPGWPYPGAPFVRPLVNSAFAIGYSFFGRNWSYYLIANYIVLSASIAVSWHILTTLLRVPIALAGAATLIILFSAAGQMSWIHPSYVTDTLVGLWLACAFVASRSPSLAGTLATVLFLLLAVGTKETAIVGLCACLAQSFLRWARDTTRARSSYAWQIALLMLPGLAWVLLRLTGPNPISAYPLSTLTHWTPATALSQWPALALHGTDFSQRPSLRMLAVLVNSALLCALTLLLIKRWRNRIHPTFPDIEFELGLWVAIWFGFLMAVTPEGRHGYGMVLLAVPLICLEITTSRRRWAGKLLAVLLAALALPAARTSILLLHKARATTLFSLRYRAAQDLFTSIRTANSQQCQTIYILHNVVEYGSSEALGLFTGSRARIVNLTTLDGDLVQSTHDEGAHTFIDARDGRYRIESRIPYTLHFIFDVPPNESNHLLTREGARFSFPAALSSTALGNRVQIDLSPVTGDCLLAWDFSHSQFRLSSLAPSH